MPRNAPLGRHDKSTLTFFCSSAMGLNDAKTYDQAHSKRANESTCYMSNLIIVVGGGACGLVASLRAAQDGCRVVVFEKAGQRAGNTFRSTGKNFGRFELAEGQVRVNF